MKDQIEAQVTEAEKGQNYTGPDWWQLSEEERRVFDIDPKRWPRMMVAVTAYDVFLGLTDAETLGFDEETVKRLRLERSDLVETGPSSQSFAKFATEYGGLTSREAAAAYWKNRFWLARTGHLTYPDEETGEE